MEILTDKLARMDDGKWRVHCAPTFCRLAGGPWLPIESVVSIKRVDGAYIVAAGDEWIRFAPRVRLAGQLVRAVVTPFHFGDVLDAKAKPDAAQYDVTFSKAVEPVKDGWQFKHITGTELGVFLHDWRERFGADAVKLTSNAAEVDLTAAVADEFGHINLDPTIYLASYYEFYYSAPWYAWATIRSGATGTQIAGSEIQATRPSATTVKRLCLRFDTSAVAGTVTACILDMLTTDSGGVGRDNFHVSKCAFASALSDAANYHEVYNRYESAWGIGRAVADSGNWYKSGDFCGAGKPDAGGAFEKTGHFDVGLAEYVHDRQNLAPTYGENHYVTFDLTTGGGNGPYLSITATTGSPAAYFYSLQRHVGSNG